LKDTWGLGVVGNRRPVWAEAGKDQGIDSILKSEINVVKHEFRLLFSYLFTRDIMIERSLDTHENLVHVYQSIEPPVLTVENILDDSRVFSKFSLCYCMLVSLESYLSLVIG
jgi:hypothetical protein